MADNKQIKDLSYMGKGIIYLGLYPSGPLLPVGNCSALNVSITEDKKELPNYMDAGGGNRNEVSRIQSVNASITAHDLSPRNLAMALRGSTELAEPATVTGEEHTGHSGALVDLAWIPDPLTLLVRSADSTTEEISDEEQTVPSGGLITTSKAIGGNLVVTDSTGATTYLLGTDYEVTADGKIQAIPTAGISESDVLKISYTGVTGTTYTAGADYEITPAGLRITSEDFADGLAIKVDYTPVPQTNLETLTGSGQEFRMVFDGLNEAQSGKAVKIRALRFKPSPTDGLDWIGDDFAEMTLVGGLLADPMVSGSGVSKFMKVQMAD